MKVKVADAFYGNYGYDCIEVDIDRQKTQICFKKEENVALLKGKEIELTFQNGIYKIKETINTKTK